MPRDFFDPTPEQQKRHPHRRRDLHQAETLIESREHCNPNGADLPFDWILDRITRSNPTVTDYLLEEPAKCPKCRHDILEKMVEPE